MSLPHHDVKLWLARFEALCAKSPGPVPLSISLGPKTAQTHFVFGGAIHGDEPGAIPAFVHAIENFAFESLNAHFTFFAGNREAILADRRFMEFDLNRIFLESSQISKEHARAKELMALLKTADFLVDFHQTVQPPQSPFYVFMGDLPTEHFVRALGVTKVCVIDTPAVGLASSDQFVQQRGGAATTMEIGMAGINEDSFETVMSVIARVHEIAASKELLAQLTTPQKFGDFSLRKIKIVHQIKCHDENDELIPGLMNLQPVSRGSVIGKRASGEPIVSPVSGYLCFPKYSKRDAEGNLLGPKPANICEIAEDQSPQSLNSTSRNSAWL